MRSEPVGVLPVDKTEGPTSHDVVAAARRALRTRRVGHTGTLDPFASGLLLLCIGRATRLAEYLTDLPKTYRAVMRLGTATDTDDLMGEPVSTSEAWRTLEPEAVAAALQSQQGERLQRPPAYSAKKVAGERAYRRARRGEAVALEPVPVTIHRIAVLDIEPPDVTFEVECSSGTYIRAIARDAGAELGVGGHLVALRRTRIGDHEVERAVPLDRLDDAAAVEAALLAPLDAVRHLPRADVDDRGAASLEAGAAVPAPERLPEHAPVAVANGRRLVAIAERDGDRLRPRKVFPHG